MMKIPDRSDCEIPSCHAHYDVLIVGAGMVGLALAAALQQTSLKVAVIEAQAPATRAAQDDGRASAIALGSVQILDQIGAWQPMQALGVSPIHQVKVSDQGTAVTATLRREDLGVEALGYVVENWVTTAALRNSITPRAGVDWFCPATVAAIAHAPDQIQAMITLAEGEQRLLSARLLVGADGRQSPVRQWAQIPVKGWAYDQALIVCTITTEHSHQQTGYERFHASGPFALLPMIPPPDAPTAHRCCVVWTARADERDALMALDDAAFQTAIQPRLSPALGQVQSVSPRFCYAPRRQNAERYFDERLVLVGDAAHATHPVGGQGLNMGLRDVAALATLLGAAHCRGQDVGDRALLDQYQRQRRRDNETVLFGTDTANRLFSNTWLPLRGLRQLGLLGLDQVVPLKRVLMRYAMGLAH